MRFFEPREAVDPERTSQIQAWVRDRLNLGEDAVVMVSELRCSEPGCPPLETLVAVLEGPGQRRQFKLHKPIAEITAGDIESATWSA
jgi:hypothetical protein